MKHAAIIQARMGSSRMAGKILQPFYNGETILSIITDRLSTIPGLDVIIATTESNKDDEIEQFALKRGIKLFRGSENDVLLRFIEAAEKFDVENIIRICSDNPFLSGDGIKNLINASEKDSYDYISFKIDGKPSILTHFGFYAEFITLKALKTVQALTDLPIYHEHVTNYIYNNPDEFNINWLNADKNLEGRNDIRLTIDNPLDFQNAQLIYSQLKEGDKELSIGNIIDALDSHPEILDEMKKMIRKNGK